MQQRYSTSSQMRGVPSTCGMILSRKFGAASDVLMCDRTQTAAESLPVDLSTIPRIRLNPLLVLAGYRRLTSAQQSAEGLQQASEKRQIR